MWYNIYRNKLSIHKEKKGYKLANSLYNNIYVVYTKGEKYV